MSDNATATTGAESPPAKRGRRAAASTSKTVNKGELAARLFVKLYEPGGGRTPEYYAQRALSAAEAFLKELRDHR